MDKRWLGLVFIGVALAVILVGWELFLTFSGFKGDFSYSLVEIPGTLYEDVKTHFQADPKFSQYEQEASTIEGIDAFK